MAQFMIDDLPEAVRTRLRAMAEAANAGQSAQAEIDAFFGGRKPRDVVDGFLADRRRPWGDS